MIVSIHIRSFQCTIILVPISASKFHLDIRTSLIASNCSVIIFLEQYISLRDGKAKPPILPKAFTMCYCPPADTEKTQS